MDKNPVLKPKLATPALILSSVAVIVCTIYLVGAAAANGRTPLILTLATAASLLIGTLIGAIWLIRARRLHTWTTAAREMWDHLDAVRRTRRTTTDVTLLGVDALEPTGSWITIRWNRFNYVQHAWIENVPEPIWPGSVLLISPDPAQITPGAPWPATYYIRAADCLAWAPLAAYKVSGESRVERSNPQTVPKNS
ncbi:hypothetical protein [Arthrobacter sp. Soil762]|uniref:hypothetical protein n=1 Tax=Arthrobacter sp. Soil762 TaxID=1736401 RepID=UPI0007138027|nr:hypothetical protein [Arthrobacter sp. Soil762]KRE72698.1 hypothetical protein ASG77_08520 [Arthrobacter sp. Soil762]